VSFQGGPGANRFKAIQRDSKPIKALWKKISRAVVRERLRQVQNSGLNTIPYLNHLSGLGSREKNLSRQSGTKVATRPSERARASQFAPMLTYYNHFDPPQFFRAGNFLRYEVVPLNRPADTPIWGDKDGGEGKRFGGKTTANQGNPTKIQPLQTTRCGLRPNESRFTIKTINLGYRLQKSV
jgi:hypothetical protein